MQKLPLKQKAQLRHRQLVDQLAHQKFAVGPHVIGFGIDLDLRRRAIVDHALLADFAGCFRARPTPPHLKLALVPTIIAPSGLSGYAVAAGGGGRGFNQR
jgi:hypothetical protein